MIRGTTKLIAHLGYPTTTFKAPMIYNPWFAHRGIDVLFGQRTAPRQTIENATKPFRQIVEQCRCPSLRP